MSLKDNVLETLINNEIISGEHMANMFHVSRSAIWKAINGLKNDGYNISGKSNQGYYLTENINIYSKAYLEKYLTKSFHIDIFDEIDSTSSYLKKIVDEYKMPCLCIALKQTSGRGRTGKSFYSSLNGIYFSFSFNVKEDFDLSLITIKVAVATIKAIENIFHKKIQVKWVNDLYYQNKKVCGILTEAIMDYESLKVDTIIIGIGINLNQHDFPKELANIASSLNIKNCNKNLLIATIINNFFNENNHNDTISFYKQHCLILNKNISYIKNNNVYHAKALDINNEGHLIVKNEFNQIEILKSGEVSLGSIRYE